MRQTVKRPNLRPFGVGACLVGTLLCAYAYAAGISTTASPPDDDEPGLESETVQLRYEESSADRDRLGLLGVRGRNVDPAPPTAPTIIPAVSNDDEVCMWWAPSTGKKTDTECGVYALRRMMGADTITRATARAQECTLRHGAECVLSHEVGFKLPAVLIWNSERAAMQMYLLPRIFAPNEGSHEKRVAMARPSTRPSSDGPEQIVRMNDTIDVEYVDTVTRRQVRETLHGVQAFCLQLLKYTVPDECSEGL